MQHALNFRVVIMTIFRLKYVTFSIFAHNIHCGYSLEPAQYIFLAYNPNFTMSRVMRKPDFCIYENKDADQLRGNREANQRLCFRYTPSTIPLLPKSEILSL